MNYWERNNINSILDNDFWYEGWPYSVKIKVREDFQRCRTHIRRGILIPENFPDFTLGGFRI